MVEGGGFENRCTLTGTGGSNPPLSAIFFAQKKWRTKPQGFTSLRVAQLHLKPQVFFTSSQNSRSLACEVVRSLVKTFRLRSTCLSRRNEMKPDEVFSLREYGWCSLYFALRLHGGFAALIFTPFTICSFAIKFALPWAYCASWMFAPMLVPALPIWLQIIVSC